MSSDTPAAQPAKQTVKQFISQNFSYVGEQSELWDYLNTYGLLDADPTKCINDLKFLIGKCHCKCDLEFKYAHYEFHRGDKRWTELAELVKPRVTSDGVCPIHPGRTNTDAQMRENIISWYHGNFQGQELGTDDKCKIKLIDVDSEPVCDGRFKVEKVFNGINFVGTDEIPDEKNPQIIHKVRKVLYQIREDKGYWPNRIDRKRPEPKPEDPKTVKKVPDPKPQPTPTVESKTATVPEIPSAESEAQKRWEELVLTRPKRLMNSCILINEKKHGMEQWFYASGKLMASWEWNHGVKVGEWNDYWANGLLRRRRIWKDGKLASEEMVNPTEEIEDKAPAITQTNKLSLTAM